MRTVKDGLPTPSGEGEESERPEMLTPLSSYRAATLDPRDY